MSASASSEAAFAERLARLEAAIARAPDPLRHPLGLTFRPFDTERHLASWDRLAALAAEGRLHDGLVLYVHIPFCARVCGYCLLASRPTDGRARLRRYLAALEREIDLYAPRVERMRVRTVHVGGGTPTLLTADELEALLRLVRERFRLDERVEIGVEAHPTTTTPEKMAALARQGVGRVSFGVETFEPSVLAAVQRSDQTGEGVRRAVRAARDAGIGQVNIDLLAGLPGESVASFAESVRRALALEPDSMSVNRYLAESSPLAAYGYVPDAEEDARTSSMLLEADRVVRSTRPPTLPSEPLAHAGFGTQYVWDRSGQARAYFQSDMIGPSSVLTLGHGVLGHVHGGTYYTSGASLERWMDVLLAGDAPPVRVRPLGMRFERAFFLTDRMSRGALDPAEYRGVFGHDAGRAFGPELAFLAARGLVDEASPGRWRKRPSLAFQALHLLAFLVDPGAGIAESEEPDSLVLAAAGDTAAAARSRIVVSELHAALDGLRALPRRPAGMLELEVTRALRAEEASALREAAERTGWTIAVIRPDDDAVLRQYGAVGAEVPPSVLWCRIAMAAATAAREHEVRSLVR